MREGSQSISGSVFDAVQMNSEDEKVPFFRCCFSLDRGSNHRRCCYDIFCVSKENAEVKVRAREQVKVKQQV